MRPIGKNLLIRQVNEEYERPASLILRPEKRKLDRFWVIDCGAEVKEVKSGDYIRIYQDMAQDHDLDFEGKVFIINEAHVVVIE